MSVNKTIAIVGSAAKPVSTIAGHLASAGYRLLLVSNGADQLATLLKELCREIPGAEVDLVDCVKDGCWEADIIFLNVDEEQEVPVARMISEVATQKIVAHFSKGGDDTLRRLLPYAKVVFVSGMLPSGAIGFSGADRDATAEIAAVFRDAGYLVGEPVEGTVTK